VLSLRARDVVGRKVLIIGDVGVGKTSLTARLLEELLAMNLRDIVVIDLAPSHAMLRGVRVGSRLREYTFAVKEVRYIAVDGIKAPRLEAKSADELLKLVEENRRLITPIFKEYLEKPSEALIVNDLSIFFHFGEVNDILKCAGACKTFIANAYYGEKLRNDYGTSISIREKMCVEELMKYMDLVVKL